MDAAASRSVRPRLSGTEIPSSGSSALPSVAIAGTCPRVLSPLVGLLEQAVSNGRVVKDATGKIFTGFATYGDLASSRCKFLPMNSNRAINRDVVRQRVKENLERYGETGEYMEFGQINLIIVAQDASHDFLVMDGQHRCETMQELYNSSSAHSITFQFRAKVVESEAEAFVELKHFQRSYPTDNRSFFRSRAEARAATAVLLQIKALYPSAFRETDMVLSDRRGRVAKDPARPYLNDYIMYWLLQDAGLVGGADASDTPHASQEGSADAASSLAALLRMNMYLATLTLADLGKGATANMQQIAGKTGCWLGFFREGMLQWEALREKMAAAAHLLNNTIASHSSSSNGEEPQCVVCLDQAPVSALLPCGHRCVCETCGEAVRDQRPAVCPLCRRGVTGAQRIYIS